MEILLWALSALLVGTGMAGTLLPLLPGIPLVFAGLLLAAWIGGFERVGWAVLVALGLLTLLSLAIDALAASLGARHVGASRAAVLGAALGTLAGIFFGLPGLLIGPFAGAALGQLLVRQDLAEAGRVGFAAWIGFLLGSLAKLALGALMLTIFAVAWFV
jgi:hypothetical protein